MHRIDGAGATIDNLFTEGDPVSGVPATTVTGTWLNAVQEEIAHVIETAGIALSKPDNTQLFLAIQSIASAAQGFSTGDIKTTLKTVADAGWVMCNDGTIGNAASGGTTRANSDTADLFALVWNNIPNSLAAVSGGRGASAAADFAANKTIALPKMLGRALASAGSGAGLSARALGQYTGTETHVIAESELPAHSHTGTTVSGGAHTHTGTTDAGGAHSHTVAHGTNTGGTVQAQAGSRNNDSSTTTSTQPAHTHAFTTASAGAHTHTFTTADAGGGGAHNNMQPTSFVNVMVKL